MPATSFIHRIFACSYAIDATQQYRHHSSRPLVQQDVLQRFDTICPAALDLLLDGALATVLNRFQGHGHPARHVEGGVPSLAEAVLHRKTDAEVVPMIPAMASTMRQASAGPSSPSFVCQEMEMDLGF